MRSSPRTHFGDLFGRGTTGETDRRRQSFERPPMVTGDGWGDSGRGEAGLEVGEGGGGAGEGARTRNRSMVAGGRRSRGGAAAACSARALAQQGRRELSGNKNKHQEKIRTGCNTSNRSDRSVIPVGPVIIWGVTRIYTI